MTDYSKFHKLIQEEEENEKQEKEAERMRLRLKYEKKQAEERNIYDEKLRKEGKDPVEERKKYGGCAFQHMQQFAKYAENDSHKHNHNDNHNHKHNHNHNHSHKSSCGYMPIEEIKKMEKERKKKSEELPLKEKNKKKIIAVYAAKQDGNRLFKEENYELAYKVYERGVLIINGTYGLNDKQEEEMEHVEFLLDLNMALTSLRMENWTEAINCCKMAIQIDDKKAKAYYRWSEALIGMSEYNQARQQSNKAKELLPNNIAIDRQLKKIDELQKRQLDKAKTEEEKFSKRIQAKIFKKNKEEKYSKRKPKISKSNDSN